MLALEIKNGIDITLQEMYDTAERVVRSFNLSHQQADDALQESVIELFKRHTLLRKTQSPNLG